MVLPIWAPSSPTIPRAIRPTQSAFPSMASPLAATATSPVPAPTVTSRRHTCPATLAWSSRMSVIRAPAAAPQLTQLRGARAEQQRR